jgi:hypothetical protein
MRTRQVRVGVALAVAALLGLGVACEQATTADMQATACEELAQLDAAHATLNAIGPNATVGALQDARKEVKKQADETRQAVRAYNQAKVDDLEAAVNNLERAAKDISSGDSIAEARASIQDDLAAVQAARAKLRADLRCP